MKSLFKLIKVNYRNNYIGYIIIGILLLIPIAYCAIQTYNLYDAGYSIEDVENVNISLGKQFDEEGGSTIVFCNKHYSLNELQKVFPPYVGDFIGPTFIFSLLNSIVLITTFILSRKNRTIRKLKVCPFTILSLILYGVILSLILIWFDSITIVGFYEISDDLLYSPRGNNIFILSLYCTTYIISVSPLIYLLINMFRKIIYKLQQVGIKKFIAITLLYLLCLLLVVILLLITCYIYLDLLL